MWPTQSSYISDSRKYPNTTDGKNERLCKLKTLSDMFNDLSAKFYNPLEHLAWGKVAVKFKRGWGSFQKSYK